MMPPNRSLAAFHKKVGNPTSPVTIESRFIQPLEPNEVLVRAKFCAINPVDYMVSDFGFYASDKDWPIITGSDVAGEVVAVGSKASYVKEGDRVILYSHWIQFEHKYSGFQEYVTVPEDSVAKIPDHLSFEEGAVMPMALYTAAAGLFLENGIPGPGLNSKATTHQSINPKHAILVWAASSSVGSAVVQLSHHLEIPVFATASPHNHEFVKSLGADQVFDHKSDTVVHDIINAVERSGLQIAYGFDAIANKNTFPKSVAVMEHFSKQDPHRNGKDLVLASVLEYPKDLPSPKGVKAAMLLAFNIYREDGNPEIGEWLFNKYVPRLFAEKKIVSAPRFEVVGGLNDLRNGLDQLKKGVSAKKLLIRID